ncbi:MAG: DUF1939 domain-containing protein [Elusimicrobia bacterium]|nr:DUF1939 domain-containing protein [Elusimicrobiota bacterium]
MTRTRPAALVLSAVFIAFCAWTVKADDDVMLQGFYWDAPQGWYKTLAGEAPRLGKAGFTSIWLPPPSKGASGAVSNGYDPYDHYDLGEFDQKGSVATRWGTRQDLANLIAALKSARIVPLADVVFNHMMGADAQETSPVNGATGWTRFDYAHRAPAGAPTWRQVESRLGRAIPHAASEPYLFRKTWQDFHPSREHPDTQPPYHDAAFGTDLCQQHDWVSVGLKLWGDWLVDSVGYGGFRIDYAKGLDPGFLREWVRDGSKAGKLTVLEVWDSVEAIQGYARETGAHAFDFPLFFKLRDMANDLGGSFDMKSLDGYGFAARDPMHAVTFTANHDTARDYPVTGSKMMAYAYILALEGYPSVFYQDYEALRTEIDALISVRKRLAGGPTATLHTDAHLFIAQRGGLGRLPGLVLVLNNDPSEPRGAWVTVKKDWAGKVLKDYSGRSPSLRVEQDARVRLSAPARGYSVYGPEGF